MHGKLKFRSQKTIKREENVGSGAKNHKTQRKRKFRSQKKHAMQGKRRIRSQKPIKHKENVCSGARKALKRQEYVGFGTENQ